MSFDSRGTPNVLPKAMENYMQSKIGGAWLAGEFADRLGGKGILSIVSSFFNQDDAVTLGEY
jgi:retinol dehydrogenase-12